MISEEMQGPMFQHLAFLGTSRESDFSCHLSKLLPVFPVKHRDLGKIQRPFGHLLIFKMLCSLEFVVKEVFCWNQQYSGYRAVFTLSYTGKWLGMGAVQMDYLKNTLCKNCTVPAADSTFFHPV